MLIAVGLFTRISALISSINMLVAVLSLAFIRGEPFPIYEKTLLYFVFYLSLIFTGPGRFSLDAFIMKR
jgi:putative oxidoreductase